MKLNKRLFSVCLVFVLLAFVFSACQFQNTERKTDITTDEDELTAILNKYDELGYTYSYSGEACTITMAHWDSSGAAIEKAVVEAVLQGFKKRYPTINVKLDILQDYEATYGNYIGAGTAHDVFLVPDGAISAWASSGKLENLTPYIEASDVLNLGSGLSTVYSSCLTR